MRCLDLFRRESIQIVGGVSDCITDAWRDPNDGTRKLPTQWTGKTEFRILPKTWGATPSVSSNTADTPENDVLKDTQPHPGWLSLVTVRNGKWLTVLKAITSLVHGGRPTHFEQLKTDKKQMANFPYMQKKDILRDTWCACDVSWNHKRNDVANTVVQVELLRQNGKKARTKLFVSRTTEGTPHVGSSMCRDQEPLRQGERDRENQFDDHYGTGRLQHWKVWSPSKVSGPTKIRSSLQVHDWGVGLEPTQ